MNLISCDNCAVVLDADKLCFPSSVWKDDGYGGNEVDSTKAEWNGERHVRFTKCPHCSHHISDPDA